MMKKINNINIHDGEVGLAFSGGADSSLLLYILLSNCTETVHLYSFLSQAKEHAQEPAVDRVLFRIVTLTGNYNYTHTKIRIKEQLPLEIHATMNKFIESDNLSVMYNGITKLPPDKILDTFDEDIRHSDEYCYRQRRDNIVRDEYYDLNFYRPFINYSKKEIANLYKQLNIEKDLFSLTRSCETPQSPNRHCGKCFWCQERSWGFGYLE